MEIREPALEIKILTARVTSRNIVTETGDLIKVRRAMATDKPKRSREMQTMEETRKQGVLTMTTTEGRIVRVIVRLATMIMRVPAARNRYAQKENH